MISKLIYISPCYLRYFWIPLGPFKMIVCYTQYLKYKKFSLEGENFVFCCQYAQKILQKRPVIEL